MRSDYYQLYARNYSDGDKRQWRRSQRMYDHPRRKRRRRRASHRRRPKLQFTPTAWAKLLYLRDIGPTEVGGFGITPADDLLLVEEFVLIPQVCTEVTVAFDDAAVADFFEEQVDEGRRPEQFARIWLHTHPWDSAAPSGVDEETFGRVFGRYDWAVMFILARGGQIHADLSWPQGGGARIRLDVERTTAGRLRPATTRHGRPSTPPAFSRSTSGSPATVSTGNSSNPMPATPTGRLLRRPHPTTNHSRWRPHDHTH